MSTTLSKEWYEQHMQQVQKQGFVYLHSLTEYMSLRRYARRVYRMTLKGTRARTKKTCITVHTKDPIV